MRENLLLILAIFLFGLHIKITEKCLHCMNELVGDVYIMGMGRHSKDNVTKEIECD